MENTEELEIDIDDIGTILKSSRLKQKKSLEDVSSDLCIRKIYLTALEEGDYETLPPVPYGIGYVRTYANYLGLSSERAVKLYKSAALIEEQNKTEEVEVAPEINKSNNKHILFGFLVLVAVYGCWVLFSSLTSSSNTTENSKNKMVEDSSSSVIEVIENDNENLVSQIEEKVVENKENNDTEELNKTTEDDTTINDNTEENKEETVDENKVVVKFNGESWVELKDRKKVYFQGVYHKGDVKEIEYVDNLFISAGRPKNVEVYVKGVKKNLLAKRRKTNILVDSLE